MAAKDRPYKSSEFDPCDQGTPRLKTSPDEMADVPDEADLAAHEVEELFAVQAEGEREDL
ncbi:hypothetical protein AAK967_04380 [Atopobiaceae bacterium 24-176]